MDGLSDDGSFASVDDLDGRSTNFARSKGFSSPVDEGEGRAHLHELSKLAEKDPEFYKYLQQNDRELLEFDPTAVDDEDEEMSDAEEAESLNAPVLTKDTMQSWQKALLEVRYPSFRL